jgi:hypothetical protein
MEKKLRKRVARRMQESLLKRKKAKAKGRGFKERARRERQREIRRRLYCVWHEDAYWGKEENEVEFRSLSRYDLDEITRPKPSLERPSLSRSKPANLSRTSRPRFRTRMESLSIDSV